MPAVLEQPVRDEDVEAKPASCDHHEIELRAYFRYLDRGCSDGFDVDDWIAAETELRADLPLDDAMKA